MLFNIKHVAKLLIATQLLTSIAPVYSNVKIADSTLDNKKSPFSVDNIAGTVSSLGASAQNDTLSDTAYSMAANQAASSAQNFLDKFGTAKVNLQFDHNASLKNSSVDVLLPLYDNKKSVLFTQLGMRNNDDYFTTNLGVGYRHNIDSWMLGSNLFWDSTWNNVNQRYGVGFEAWRDYLKLSFNGYRRISGWHQSRQHEDYDERPANGWDVRAEAWLPEYPQLGGKLMFEQYYGRNVALLNWSTKQKDPYAVTVGMDYTPVPLITAGLDYKNGKSGKNEAQFNLIFNYQIGVSLQKQLNPDAVAATRMLSGSRLDLVERNNNVVLDYKKQELITLGFPHKISGEENATYTFIPVIESKYGVQSLQLNDAQLKAAGGDVIENTPHKVTLILPSYTDKNVILSGVAIDKHGNMSNVADTIITVSKRQRIISINADKQRVLADGIQSSEIIVNVKDSKGNSITNEKVLFDTSGGTLSASEVNTDAGGDAKVMLTSKIEGTYNVTGKVGAESATHNGIVFYSINAATISSDRRTAVADGKEKINYTLVLTNQNSLPVEGRNVEWKTSLGKLSSKTQKTDKNGISTVSLSSSTVGEALVTAIVDNNEYSAESTTFTENKTALNIVIDKTIVDADGQDKVTATVEVRDSMGALLENKDIEWFTSHGELSASSGKTDANGRAYVMLSSTDAGSAIIKAKMENETVESPTVTFRLVSFITTGADRTEVAANGTDKAVITAIVTNSQGKPLENQKLSWKTTAGKLSTTSSITNSDGTAIVEISSQSEGKAAITASTSDSTSTIDISFINKAASLELKKSADEIIANGKSNVEIIAVVKDTSGKTLKGQEVTFNTDKGDISVTKALTDTSGEARTVLTSKSSGQITVNAYADDLSETVQILATEPVPVAATAIAVDSAGTNVNNISFGTHSPKYAWPQAKIRLAMPGAVGDVTWTSDTNALSINDDVVTFKSEPGTATIMGVDTEGNKAIYNILLSKWVVYVSDFSAFYGAPNYSGTSAYGTCDDKNAHIMSLGTYQSIYKEWGNLYKYNGWERNFYHTSNPYSGSDPQVSNYYFWGEDGTSGKNNWSMINFACE